MKTIFIYLLIALLLVVNVTATTVKYTITIEGASNNQTASENIDQTEECDLECTFPLPKSTVENISSFSISNYDTKTIKDIKFISTNASTTQNNQDQIYVLLEKKSVNILSIAPNLLYQGSNNLIIQVENDGSEELLDLYATISGEGIKTKDSTKLDSLKPKQSAFLNVLLDVSAQDKADIIVKVFSASNLMNQQINSISIKSEEKPKEESKQALNITDAMSKIGKSRDDIRKYEEEMYNKKADGYDVSNIAGEIDQTKGLIQKIQLEYVRYTQQDFDVNYNVILSNLDDVKSNLNVAQPAKTLGDRIKDNIILISTAIGLIISAFTAWGLAKSHVNVEAIKKLKRKKK